MRRKGAQKPKAPRSVVERRRANNDKRPRSTGFQARVADNDPMQKDSETNYP